MGTELATDRLHRRLGGDTDSESSADDDGTSDAALSRWLPDPATSEATGWLAAARADPGRAGAVALGAVGVVAVLVTVVTLLRDDTPPPVVSAKLPPVEMVSTQSSPVAPTPAGPVIVSVVGLVQKPGLVTLSSGARIADALSAAGGALDGADLIGLNMARRVADGEQIIVGIAAPPGEPTSVGSSVASEPTPDSAPGSVADGSPAAAASVDLNTATEEQLDALPGVGPVTAAAIIAWRTANGSFASVDQLADVDGIGPARLDKLRAQVHV